MSAITRELTEFVAQISYDTLPAEVGERAKLLITDMIGIALRARHDAESTPSLLASTEKLGLTNGNASVIGDAAGYTAPGAALINGPVRFTQARRSCRRRSPPLR